MTDLATAARAAQQIIAQLRPHCIRIEVAGSIRRRAPSVTDIDIVAIPKPYTDLPLFADGVATVLNQWPCLKGPLPGKYTRRAHPSGLEIDVYFASPGNYGFLLAVRTGPARFSHHTLAAGWSSRGYSAEGGYLRDQDGVAIPCPEETDLFRLAGVPWTPPNLRT